MSSNHNCGSYKCFASLASLSTTLFPLRLVCENEAYVILADKEQDSLIMCPNTTMQGWLAMRCLKITSESPLNTTSYSPISIVLGHMCFSCYRTYVMILCNWLIFWQNAFYLYLDRLRMCLNTSRNHVSRSSVEAFKSVQEIKQKCKFIKAWQLVDTCSTPPIY